MFKGQRFAILAMFNLEVDPHLPTFGISLQFELFEPFPYLLENLEGNLVVWFYVWLVIWFVVTLLTVLMSLWPWKILKLYNMTEFVWICPKYDWICPKYDCVCQAQTKAFLELASYNQKYFFKDFLRKKIIKYVKKAGF